MTFPLSIETERLQLRRLDFDDASFVLELVNDSDWIRYIGDKQVHNIADARRYLESGPMAMYREQGFGLNRVALKHDDTPIGICGILQRDDLDYVDLGFALLPAYRKQGYAAESAQATLEAAFVSGIARVCAILQPQNQSSRKLLLKLGFEGRGQYEPQARAELLDLYVIETWHDKV